MIGLQKSQKMENQTFSGSIWMISKTMRKLDINITDTLDKIQDLVLEEEEDLQYFSTVSRNKSEN